jgi:mannosyltransferase OCH1-like enzyme
MENIIVTDNFLTTNELNIALNILKDNSWTYGHKSNSKTDEIIKKQEFWNMTLDENEFFSIYLKNVIEKHVSKNLKLKRVYANGMTFGQEPSFHQDDSAPNTYTFCLYLTKIEENHIETAGGYIFFKMPNEKYDICFEPVFNRGIFFPSNYLHKASPFTRYIMDLRICVAWKFEEILNENIEELITIPKIISRKEEIKIETLIPKTIMQTYKNNSIDNFIYDNIMKMLDINKEYEYRFITDEDIVEIIKTHFDSEVLEAFNKIKLGAAQGDFKRYIYLYIYGGIYLDLDASIEIDLNKMFLGNKKERFKLLDDVNKQIFVDYEGDFINKEFIFLYNEIDFKIEQWLIMAAPRNEIINRTIKEMVIRVNSGEENIFIATGPTLFTDVIYNLLNDTNIYDINKNLTIHERFLFLNSLKENNNQFIKNGVFYNRDLIENWFRFTMKDYKDSHIYKDIKKYNRHSSIFNI